MHHRQSASSGVCACENFVLFSWSTKQEAVGNFGQDDVIGAWRNQPFLVEPLELVTKRSLSRDVCRGISRWSLGTKLTSEIGLGRNLGGSSRPTACRKHFQGCPRFSEEIGTKEGRRSHVVIFFPIAEAANSILRKRRMSFCVKEEQMTSP